jgi:hypothetical protein
VVVVEAAHIVAGTAVDSVHSDCVQAELGGAMSVEYQSIGAAVGEGQIDFAEADSAGLIAAGAEAGVMTQLQSFVGAVVDVASAG